MLPGHAGDEEACCGSNQGILCGECHRACCTALQAAGGSATLRPEIILYQRAMQEQKLATARH